MLYAMAFGFAPFQFTGALNNWGEDVVLSDATGAVVDNVEYSSSSPWPTSANGTGPSLSLCDVDADNNDPANWCPSTTDYNGDNGTPGADNIECP